jgi:importin-4
VADINRNVAENLRFCGPALVADESMLQKVIQVVMDITSRKHPCQEDFGADEELQEAMEETSEFDWIVIDTALEVVSGLAAALGESFAGLWKIFQKTLLRFAGSSENIERSTAVGVLSECIIGMGSAVTPYTASFLRLLIHRLRDEDPQTKSNAAYALGRLIEKSSADAEILTEYPAILERLEPCLRQEYSRLPDNATGCLSRMILKHHNNVPLGEVLPAIVEVLPLKEDYEENGPLYRMVCQMCMSWSLINISLFGYVMLTISTDKWEDTTIRQLTPSLLPIFQSVLCGDENQLEDERRHELIELVTWLNKVQPGVAPWVEQLG